MEDLFNEEKNIKEIKEDDLNKISEDNPLVVFSECDADGCLLNRAKSPVFRLFF